MTGAVSREEAVPPVAGAALHPSQNDPGHVHPHVTFTGQLSQHQAVHIAMKEETGFVLQTCFWEKPPPPTAAAAAAAGCRRHRFLPHHWSTLKHFLSWRVKRERERGCISLRNLRRDVRQSFRRKWMTGTQIKDTADFMKREVGGSKRCT